MTLKEIEMEIRPTNTSINPQESKPSSKRTKLADSHFLLETTQLSINRRMDKQNTIYPCNGIIFGHKKEWILILAVTLMHLENLLNERRQIEKSVCYVIPLD